MSFFARIFCKNAFFTQKSGNVNVLFTHFFSKYGIMNLVKKITKLTFGVMPERGKNMGTKILVVDDEAGICDLLKIYFEREGYEVKTASDGVEGISYFKMYEPDLVLLDIMLPKKDGWQVCREIREMSGKPVIMITAKGDVFDKVLGLELGADDFVVKPFDMKELSARVKAVLRRYSSPNNLNDDEAIKFDNIEISRQKYELKLNRKAVDIPPQGA